MRGFQWRLIIGLKRKRKYRNGLEVREFRDCDCLEEMETLKVKRQT